jgi:hypothetical protein
MIPPFILLATAMIAHAIAAQAQGLVTIPRTQLRVALPEGWRIDPAADGIQSAQLRYTRLPGLEIKVQHGAAPQHGRTCMEMLAGMHALKIRGMRFEKRPAYVPAPFFGSVMSVSTTVPKPARAEAACLSTANALLTATVQYPDGSRPDAAAVTPMLQTLARAADQISAFAVTKGPRKLPVLGIEVQIPSGRWIAYVRDSPPSGKRDVLVRSSAEGVPELQITFFLPRPGRCEAMITPQQTRGGKTVVARARSYGSAPWLPDALEQFPAPLEHLEAFACRPIAGGSPLLARIEYEHRAVSADDLVVVRQVLDAAGEAYDRKMSAK